MADNTVRVVARLMSKPGRENELRGILESMLEPIRNENGCISYEMLENRADPTEFTFVEEWANDETLDAHLQGLQRNLPKLMDLFAESPDIRTYSKVG